MSKKKGCIEEKFRPEKALVKCYKCKNYIAFRLGLCEQHEIRVLCYECLKKYKVFSELFFELKKEAEKINATGFVVWIYGTLWCLERLSACATFYLTDESWLHKAGIYPQSTCRAIFLESEVSKKRQEKIKIGDIAVDILYNMDQRQQYDIIVDIYGKLVLIVPAERKLKEKLKKEFQYSHEYDWIYAEYVDSQQLATIINSLAKRYKTAVHERATLLLS